MKNLLCCLTFSSGKTPAFRACAVHCNSLPVVVDKVVVDKVVVVVLKFHVDVKNVYIISYSN